MGYQTFYYCGLPLQQENIRTAAAIDAINSLCDEIGKISTADYARRSKVFQIDFSVGIGGLLRLDCKAYKNSFGNLDFTFGFYDAEKKQILGASPDAIDSVLGDEDVRKLIIKQATKALHQAFWRAETETKDFAVANTLTGIENRVWLSYKKWLKDNTADKYRHTVDVLLTKDGEEGGYRYSDGALHRAVHDADKSREDSENERE